jgi:SpoVK/Ycf46/Vps4 family AAA+-type ATPase
VLLGEGVKLDPSLEGLIPTFTIGLPDAYALQETLEQVLSDLKGGPYELSEQLADPAAVKASLVTAALGLTCEEFGAALRLAALKSNGIDGSAVEVIRDRKLAKLRRLGADFAPAPDVSVGGLDQLMRWINTRRKLLTPEAVELGMPKPKGLLLVGVPGTGKSLVAKSIGAAWGLPVMSLDVGALYGGVVGQTEQNVRKLLATADACAPCILLIDELEKALAGASGHNGDSGVSKRLFGSLLSWMNDHQSQVFVVATANDISQLPPELKRKGRFDEIFLVGLPTKAERQEILVAHLQQQEFAVTPAILSQLVELTTGFTGAEIGAAVQAARVERFCGAEGSEEELLRQCIEQVEPQFKGKVYNTGDVNARPASTPEAAGKSSKAVAMMR